MEKHLYTVLNYFSFFSYPPSLKEIYTFFPRKISKKDLQALLAKEVKDKKILLLPYTEGNQPFSLLQQPTHYPLPTAHCPHYTLPQYSINSSKLKAINAIKRLQTIKMYLVVASHIPFVQFVGVTGSVAMLCAKKNDDVDLCVVTRKNTLWTTRFLLVILAKWMGLYGKTICLNLFFDEGDLLIPEKKQNIYIAHEILQMKPIIDKNDTYNRFLYANRWTCSFFPNVQLRASRKIQNTGPSLFRTLEYVLKNRQINIIRKNKTGFMITSRQLWLFKNDFETKLKRRGML